MSTARFGWLVTWFVVGLVVWKATAAGTRLSSPMPHARAVAGPGLMTVVNAVAAAPTRTDRLDGSTAATRATGAQALALKAKSKTPVPVVAACTQVPAGEMASAVATALLRPLLKAAQLTPLSPALSVRNTP